MAIKVYTKTGDKGTTALIGGTRVGKDHIRIEAYGTVDELNSHIGLVNAQTNDQEINEWLENIQDKLFTIGSSLATDPKKESKMKLPDLKECDIIFLEKNIDKMEDQLPALKSFVLPGGDAVSAQAHIARCVCRRAERICVMMKNNNEFVADLVLNYLNRLSDFMFVLARYILIKNGGQDVEWRPQKG